MHAGKKKYMKVHDPIAEEQPKTEALCAGPVGNISQQLIMLIIAKKAYIPGK